MFSFFNCPAILAGPDYFRWGQTMSNNKIYLAINYGTDGWELVPYDSPQQALESVKARGSYRNEWKILKELNINVEEDKP